MRDYPTCDQIAEYYAAERSTRTGKRQKRTVKTIIADLEDTSNPYGSFGVKVKELKDALAREHDPNLADFLENYFHESLSEADEITRDAERKAAQIIADAKEHTDRLFNLSSHLFEHEVEKEVRRRIDQMYGRDQTLDRHSRELNL